MNYLGIADRIFAFFWIISLILGWVSLVNTAIKMTDEDKLNLKFNPWIDIVKTTIHSLYCAVPIMVLFNLSDWQPEGRLLFLAYCSIGILCILCAQIIRISRMTDEMKNQAIDDMGSTWAMQAFIVSAGFSSIPALYFLVSYFVA